MAADKKYSVSPILKVTSSLQLAGLSVGLGFGGPENYLVKMSSHFQVVLKSSFFSVFFVLHRKFFWDTLYIFYIYFQLVDRGSLVDMDQDCKEDSESKVEDLDNHSHSMEDNHCNMDQPAAALEDRRSWLLGCRESLEGLESPELEENSFLVLVENSQSHY